MSQAMRLVVDHSDGVRGAVINAGNAALRLLQAGAVEILVRRYKSKRTIEQNDMLHGICAEIARVKPWAGRMLDTEGWKRLLVDAWVRESGQRHGDIVPSLDGQSVVVLNKSTASMNTAELSELIEFALAYAATNQINVRYAA